MTIRYLLTGALVATGIAFVTPASAQGVRIDAPGVSVGVGTDRHHHRHYDRRHHRDRDVYVYERRGPECKTITVERDDGSVKRIRKCG
jgi:hypothetical protein